MSKIDNELLRNLLFHPALKSKFPTKLNFELSKSEYKKILKENGKELDEISKKMLAQGKHSVLIIFQAMDAAGKDGTIERLLKGVNPQGVEIHSFKEPSKEELSHDFLWRTHNKVPPAGKIGVFNRSHYEEVLAVRVHPEFLENQKLPGLNHPVAFDSDLWDKRLESIRNFEEHLSSNGVTIIKFFLNVSKKEQEKRLLDRICTPEKNWKFSLGDTEEREYWDKYQVSFFKTLRLTHTNKSPWYAIPADDKKLMRVLVSEIVLSHLRKLNIEWPVVSDLTLEEMQEAKENLLRSSTVV